MVFELAHIAFAYAEKKVIHDLSVAISPGRFYGIIGPNGCGKTTVLDLLIRHKQPVGGTIAYQGNRLNQIHRRQLAKELALVPQNFYINFPYTVGEIVMMGRYPHMPRFGAPSETDREIVEDIMIQTDVHRFKRQFITELSSGERQRVIFARALAQQTPVLLLDEATSNLDVNHSLGLLKLAARRVKQEGNTVIAVLQDMNLAALFCDDLIFLKNGGIVAHGPTNQILSPETILAVFDVKAKVYQDDFAEAPQVVFRG